MKITLCLPLLLLAALPSARAATYCATTSAELQAALNSADSNQQDDVILIQTGTYNAPTGGFVFDSVAGSDDFDISLSGGWTPFFGNPCGQQVSPDAIATKLNGNGTSRVMNIYPNVHSGVHIELITFLGGNTVSAPPPQAGAGLHINSYTGYLGEITIERNIFMSNTAGNFGGGLAGADGSAVTIRNNLFLANQAMCRNGAASLTYNGSGTAYFVNNTVAFNSVGDNCNGTTAAGGLRVGGLSPAFMVNNIFWGNENIDLVLDTDVRLVGNDFQFLDGTPAAGSGVNYSLDPKFRFSTLTDMHLGNDSPLIDLGVVPLPTTGWQLSPLDLEGMTRVVGSSVDLGAYENADAIFIDGFE
ncbi:MAG: choice-of-anchor Q domain-containing protein [Rhodanobacteraceae bacterium]